MMHVGSTKQKRQNSRPRIDGDDVIARHGVFVPVDAAAGEVSNSSQHVVHLDSPRFAGSRPLTRCERDETRV